LTYEDVQSTGIAVDCREFHELISEAVDDRLRAGHKQHFSDHASVCPACRSEFEMEQITKGVVRTRIHRENAPSEIYASLFSSIRETKSSSGTWLSSIFGEAFLNPAVALVALLVVAVGAISLLEKNNAIPISTEKNIITQSINNYSAAMTGLLKPTLISHDPGDVKDYLSKDTPFEVSVASLEGCDWCGGVLSEVNGVRLVHVVYKIGGEGILYVYQVDLNEAMRGNKIGLPENAKAVLAKTGWYFEQTPDFCNVVLWRHKNTLCAAVSKMDRAKMVALLSDKDPL
jgi:hypothetical protein